MDYALLSKSSSFPLIHSVAPKAPCAAIAITVITGAPEEEVISTLDGLDPSWRRTGLYSSHGAMAFRKFGFETELVHRGKPISETFFALKNPKGTFYVCSINHAYVMHNQKIIDCVGARGSRRVHTAYRVWR